MKEMEKLSKFKWMEILQDGKILSSAINSQTLDEKIELVKDLLDSKPTEENLRAAVVTYSQITLEIAKQLVTLKEENDSLRRELNFADLKN